jgi:peptide/nickel transport system ATP-binding protein
MPLLDVRELNTVFHSRSAEIAVVRGLSLHVSAGETLAIVGESGSGKSVTALSILRLFKAGLGTSTGEILFEGRDLLRASEEYMRKLRGSRISMVFQDPMSSLNPVQTVGAQIMEAVRLHSDISRPGAQARALDLLNLVGIPAPKRRLKEYPHQLSGGMRQRVMIAMALACDPQLLIADEPTTALDVTVQAQILALIRDLQARSGSAVILITHDLGVVAELADRVLVMYAGQKVEEADVATLFSNAQHPYTRGLLGALPRIGGAHGGAPGRLIEIKGSAPAAGTAEPGCAFSPRCPYAAPICQREQPALVMGPSGQSVACHLVEPANLK